MHPLLKSKRFKPRTGSVEKCPFCSKEFYLAPSRKKLYKQSFCKKEHMIAWMKQNSFRFNCKICGIEVFTQPAQMKYRNRTTCSIVCRSKERRLRTLSQHKTLSFGKANRLARRFPELIEWRKAVFKRDDYTCQECGIRGTYLEADHIKPFAFFPELRTELSNGRTLC